jgi:hypothetical protein
MLKQGVRQDRSERRADAAPSGVLGGSERYENAAWEGARPGALGSGGLEERLFQLPAAVK